MVTGSFLYMNKNTKEFISYNTHLKTISKQSYEQEAVYKLTFDISPFGNSTSLGEKLKRVQDVELSKDTYTKTGEDAYFLKETGKELWISSSTLLPLQYTSYNEGTPTTFYFTFQFGNVTDEDVKIPDFSDYTIAN